MMVRAGPKRVHGPRPRAASSAAAASCNIAGTTSAYVFTVKLIREWPSTSITTLGGDDRQRAWPGLRSIACLESERRTAAGVTRERRHSLSSLPADPRAIAAENLAALRHLALNLLRREPTARVGVKAERRKAG